MQRHTRDTRRIRGSSIAELVFSLSLLGVGALGLDAVDIWRDAKEIDSHRYRQAVAIAQGQMEYVNQLHFEELIETQGFEPAAWIHPPGHATGELPVEIRDASGTVHESSVYRVSASFENVDDAALVRKVEVRVGWTETTGRERDYTISSVRFY